MPSETLGIVSDVVNIIGNVGKAIGSFFSGGAEGTIIPREPFYYKYENSPAIYNLRDFSWYRSADGWLTDFRSRSSSLGKAGDPIFHTLIIKNQLDAGQLEFDGKAYDRNIISVIESGDVEKLGGFQVSPGWDQTRIFTLGAAGVVVAAKNVYEELLRKKAEIKTAGGSLTLTKGLETLDLINFVRENVLWLILGVGLITWLIVRGGK